MEANQIAIFIASNGNRFPPDKLGSIRNQLSQLDDSKFPIIQSLEYKDPTTLLIVSLFLGWLGVDRFMLGETKLGILKLLTCGGASVWTIIDWFTITKRTREKNYEMLIQAIQEVAA